MNTDEFLKSIERVEKLSQVEKNLWIRQMHTDSKQAQTKDMFQRKWRAKNYQSEDFEKSLLRQRNWYLQLYGFESNSALKSYLLRKTTILDAGSGNGAKAAWFASMAPECLVVAAELSDSIVDAAKEYRNVPNLIFVQCDIGNLDFAPDRSFDYVNCDQVIHHTASPEKTFKELVRVTAPGGDVACYVYRRKAVPRELLDDKCRKLAMNLSADELYALAEQVTQLGKLLDSIEGEYEFPEIPALDIEGGRMSVQRYIYWNFLKCYWNREMGHKNSVLTNFDWYAPAQAFRYTEAEFRHWIETNELEIIHFHREPACYSGRFRKN